MTSSGAATDGTAERTKEERLEQLGLLSDQDFPPPPTTTILIRPCSRSALLTSPFFSAPPSLSSPLAVSFHSQSSSLRSSARRRPRPTRARPRSRSPSSDRPFTPAHTSSRSSPRCQLRCSPFWPNMTPRLARLVAVASHSPLSARSPSCHSVRPLRFDCRYPFARSLNRRFDFLSAISDRHHVPVCSHLPNC